MDELLKNIDIIVPVADPAKIAKGTIVRRINTSKDQQGCFTNFDDQGGMILVNVVDIKECAFVAEAGILRPSAEDSLYRFTTTFGNSPAMMDAIAIIQNWQVFKKYPALQNAILNFVESTYTPEQLVYLSRREAMGCVFIPIQQKFRIGRFAEAIDWNKVGRDKFRERLADMRPGDHVTYLAMIPQVKTGTPKFYSIGSKPHEETAICLRSEPFNFQPTHGGHIKLLADFEGNEYFLVDAGSNFKGRGVKTPLSKAEEVTDSLAQLHGEFVFKPIEGRGAFGEGQSY